MPLAALHNYRLLIANYAGPAERSNVSLPLAALNRTARGAGRIHYAERVGGDALEVGLGLAPSLGLGLAPSLERGLGLGLGLGDALKVLANPNPKP